MPVTPGTYEVDATWLAASSLSANVAYNIYDGTTKLGSVSVSQKSAPAGFTDDGVKWPRWARFTVSGALLKVTVANVALDGQVSAAAVRVLPAYQPVPIVGVATPGSWYNKQLEHGQPGLLRQCAGEQRHAGRQAEPGGMVVPLPARPVRGRCNLAGGRQFLAERGFRVYNGLKVARSR